MHSSVVQLKIVHFYSPPIKKTRLINRFSEWSRPVVPNLWYEYPWGYAADRLVVRQNNIGNGQKHQKKGGKIKTQKQSYEFLVYKE
jgi:hypothetical protein